MPPVASDDLCLLADLKAWLNITGANSGEDSILQNLITRGSLMFLRMMNRDHLISQSYAEARDGNDALFMLTRNFPISAVASVTVNGVAIPQAPNSVTAGFVFDGRRIMLQGGSNSFVFTGPYSGQFCYRFTRGFQNVALVYTAGYAQIPGDLQQAAISALAFMYKREREKGIVDSESANGMVTMSYSKKMIPDSAKMVFDQYTRRAVL